VAGGVHGTNRLGGSSLLACVVYGRVAGATASTYLMRRITAARRLGGVAGHIGMSPVTISVGGMNISISGEGSAPALAAAAPVPVKEIVQEEVKPTAPSGPKTFTMAEVAKHNTEADCWVVVNGEVLDATPFLADHPGGILFIINME
jgi:hypothetical protein